MHHVRPLRSTAVLLLSLATAACDPSSLTPPSFVSAGHYDNSDPARHDDNTAAATAWSADIESVADAVGIGSILYSGDLRKKTGLEYCNEGNSLLNQGQFRAALRAKSMALYLSKNTGDTILSAHCAAGIALVYDYVGDYKRAIKWTEEAALYLSKAYPAYGDPRPAYINTMVFKVQADAALAIHRLPEAQQAMRQALAAAQSNPPLIPWVTLGLANVLKEADPAQAMPLLNQISVNGPPPYQLVARRLLGTLQLKQHPEAARAIFADLANDAQNKGDDYTRAWAEQGLARAARILGQPADVIDHYDRAIEAANAVRDWFHTEEFRTSTFGTLQDIFDEAVELNMHAGHVDHAFELSEQARARSLRDMMRDPQQPNTQGQVLARVRSALPPNTVLVSYYVLPHELYIWKISAAGVRGISVPVAQETLRQEALVLGNFVGNLAVESPGPETTRSIQSATKLFWDNLIAPAQLPPHAHLVLVPHRVLNFLPFAALSGSSTSLLADHELSYAPSAAIWLETGARRRERNTLLAFGNPMAFGQTSVGAEELRDIQAAIPQAKIVEGAAASPKQFLDSAPGYDLLVVAAHGKADKMEPGASALYLAGPTLQQSALEAKDIYRMSLPRAALVTLSACEAGLGATSRGDEVYSLTSAFAAAGAKNVITTLWKVSDSVTAKLMARFYQQVAAGTGYAEALRRAQLALATDPATANPVYWAAFEFVGTGGE